MQRTIVVCDECRHPMAEGKPYYTITVVYRAERGRQTSDCCSDGCLLRRLSRVLPSVERAMVEQVSGAEMALARPVGLGVEEDSLLLSVP